jgi:hypothetical protein
MQAQVAERTGTWVQLPEVCPIVHQRVDFALLLVSNGSSSLCSLANNQQRRMSRTGRQTAPPHPPTTTTAIATSLSSDDPSDRHSFTHTPSTGATPRSPYSSTRSVAGTTCDTLSSLLRRRLSPRSPPSLLLLSLPASLPSTSVAA